MQKAWTTQYIMLSVLSDTYPIWYMINDSSWSGQLGRALDISEIQEQIILHFRDSKW